MSVPPWASRGLWEHRGAAHSWGIEGTLWGKGLPERRGLQFLRGKELENTLWMGYGGGLVTLEE